MQVDGNMIASIISFLASLVVILFQRNILLQMKSITDLLKKDIDSLEKKQIRHSEYFREVFSKIETNKDKLHDFDLHVAKCSKNN